jgi:hypothetical protein
MLWRVNGGQRESCAAVSDLDASQTSPDVDVLTTDAFMRANAEVEPDRLLRSTSAGAPCIRDPQVHTHERPHLPVHHVIYYNRLIGFRNCALRVPQSPFVSRKDMPRSRRGDSHVHLHATFGAPTSTPALTIARRPQQTYKPIAGAFAGTWSYM